MSHYYVNKRAQSNGDHEVHKSGCLYMPHEVNRIYLGFFSSCHGAVAKAKQFYPKSNGCYYCCNSCHTS